MGVSRSALPEGGSPVCPISSSTQTKFLCSIEGYTIWRCPSSATDFVWPMPSQHTLKSLYDREDWFEGGERGGYCDYDAQTEPMLGMFAELLDEFEGSAVGRSVLDIGCGYGNHLAVAAQRGWKCFGVEVSDHARRVTNLRHGNAFFVVDCLENLIAHEFDLIVLFDVIEHLADPYGLFYTLFSKGAIGPQTRIIITTPNARSYDAIADPAGWAYRHPPSHLVYYSAESLHALLTSLHFAKVEIAGLFPLERLGKIKYEDEYSTLNSGLAGSAGLLCKAEGSNFKSFMHERYVPGTWSKVAEYEHLPRYQFAKHRVTGAKVLDFGCGTGYGAALLAEVADSVVGLDIDDTALDWARRHHHNPRLLFEKRSDLGRSFPDHSFNVITCFEMIEHVNEEAQVDVVRQCRRLLVPGGQLIISTPNPDVTQNYGANPFHLREMTERQFLHLLKLSFEHVLLLKQWIRPSVSIGSDQTPHMPLTFCAPAVPSVTVRDSCFPLAYVAICSDQPIREVLEMCYLDSSVDHVAASIMNEKRFSALQFEYYKAHERIFSLQEQLAAKEREFLALVGPRLFRLQRALRTKTGSPRTVTAIVGLVMEVFASALVRRLAGATARVRRWFDHRHLSAPQCNSYEARIMRPIESSRPKVVHAIANFNIGGSSRLVVDLIERLGHQYEQEIITRFQPDPPSYTGVVIHEHELSCVDDLEKGIFSYLCTFRPNLFHVHYWGETDKAWYEAALNAANKFGCRIVENVNTPVTPYWGEAISRYVYVSDYVLETFGRRDRKSLVIYPGSNFSVFRRKHSVDAPRDCIGMVYRLEEDKLSPQAIDVFIKVVMRRPSTKVLIVGGGALLQTYQKTVQLHGVSNAFRFTGYVSYEELPALYEEMGVFVAPVWKESFGHVSVLAMNYGIPVVGYDVGGLAEILGTREWLAPPGNGDRLADMILDLLQDHAKCSSIGLINKKRAQEKFSVETMIECYRELYAKLLRPVR